MEDINCSLNVFTIAVGIMSLCAVFVTVSPLVNYFFKKEIKDRLKQMEDTQNAINERIVLLLEAITKKIMDK